MNKIYIKYYVLGMTCWIGTSMMMACGQANAPVPMIPGTNANTASTYLQSMCSTYRGAIGPGVNGAGAYCRVTTPLTGVTAQSTGGTFTVVGFTPSSGDRITIVGTAATGSYQGAICGVIPTLNGFFVQNGNQQRTTLANNSAIFALQSGYSSYYSGGGGAYSNAGGQFYIIPPSPLPYPNQQCTVNSITIASGQIDHCFNESGSIQCP